VGELNWLARVAAESRLWFVNAESEIDTVADARAAERIRWSATGPADNISDVAAIISHALGLNSQIITGYQGARDMALAVVNGEVDSGVISGTSVLSLVQSGRIKPIAMISRQRWDVLPDVPTIYEADGLDAEGISWLEMREDMGAVQRAMVTTPNVPEDRVAFLREVFDDVLNDPALVEEGATSNRPITYLPGEELRVLIGELMEFASGDRLEELRRIILQTYL